MLILFFWVHILGQISVDPNKTETIRSTRSAKHCVTCVIHYTVESVIVNLNCALRETHHFLCDCATAAFPTAEQYFQLLFGCYGLVFVKIGSTFHLPVSLLLSSLKPRFLLPPPLHNPNPTTTTTTSLSPPLAVGKPFYQRLSVVLWWG